MNIKKFKYIIFFIYTLFIYFFPVFIGFLVVWFCHNSERAIHSIRTVLEILSIPLPYLLEEPRGFSEPASEWLVGILMLIFIIAFYSMPFILWYLRQTVMRAFFLSLTGLFCGPGLIFVLERHGSDDYAGLMTISLLIIFYLTLYYGNKYQKRYYPNNRFANKIRRLLAWPCLRT